MDQVEDVTGLPVDPAPVNDGSILGRLRVMREDAAQEAEPTLVLDVPGYEPPGQRFSALAVVFRYPPDGYKAALKTTEVERRGKGPDPALEGNADLIIACCASIVGKDEQGKLYDLASDAQITPEDALSLAKPTRFDRAFAEQMRIDVPASLAKPGRFIVRQVFNPRAQATGKYTGDLALVGAANRVFAWLANETAVIDEALEGE